MVTSLYDLQQTTISEGAFISLHLYFFKSRREIKNEDMLEERRKHLDFMKTPKPESNTSHLSQEAPGF